MMIFYFEPQKPLTMPVSAVNIFEKPGNLKGKED